ncbi:MAG: hypothetical protein ACP5NO_08490 [Thermoplasmata archaeon]
MRNNNKVSLDGLTGGVIGPMCNGDDPSDVICKFLDKKKKEGWIFAPESADSQIVIAKIQLDVGNV